jgi:8-oxo-dGTP diphosphatase
MNTDRIYAYAHPHPAVATDIAIFTLRDGRLSILLIRRGVEPFAGGWALPGGFLRPDEDLDACAHRELKEETGVEAPVLTPFANFSAPERDPRERVISAAYLALIPSDDAPLKADTDAAEARWFAMDALPALAFDHDHIVERALARLRELCREMGILLALLPERFTLTELQTAYEAVMAALADRRNFQKQALASGLLEETEDRTTGRHRPARLWRRATEQRKPSHAG